MTTFRKKIVTLRILNLDRMPQNEVTVIDIDKVVASRAGGKKIPRFLVNWIKRFIHQDYLNNYLQQGKLGYEFAEGALSYMDITIEVEGEENIPDKGLFTFAGNHPLGGADALATVAVLGRKYNGSIVCPANDFLLNIKQLREYLIPVNKMGCQARGLGSALEEAFFSQRQVIYFPAGSCSRKIDGIIQDQPWKKSFITKSKASHRDVIPMWFSGKNSPRFYRVDAIRNFLKIKLNLAMLCLPDEMYRCRGKHFTLRFGKPIPWETFTREKKDIEWAAYVREKVYELSK